MGGMRAGGSWIAPMLLIGATACGAEFTRDTGGVDAADPVEAGADRAAGDGAPDADPPAVAEGLLLWLRADLGVTESSGAISEWSDQSGNQLHARQVEAARQPTSAGAPPSFSMPRTFSRYRAASMTSPAAYPSSWSPS